MKDLRVTHILNVSDMIPCHFEDSSNSILDSSFPFLESLNVKYMRINIED